MDRMEAFLTDLIRVKTGVLLTNYEGVLAPITVESRQTFPYSAIRSLLNDLARVKTRLIVMSSRPASEISISLGIGSTPEIWGSDGLERMTTSGAYERVSPNLANEMSLALESCKVDLDNAGLANCLETKLSGLAIHWKDRAPQEQLAIRSKAYDVLQPVVVNYRGFRLNTMDYGVELRLPITSKVDALRSLIETTPSHVPIAYLGHSIDDEECFRVLNGRGLTILVRSLKRFTAAQTHLQPLDELVCFFKNWHTAVTRQ